VSCPVANEDKMKYKIQCWIPVDIEYPEIYETEEEANLDMGSMELMQPENRYEIKEVDGDEK